MKKNYPLQLQGLYERLKKIRIPGKLIFIIMGIVSTVWFLIRVIPKPQRASYPCMKVAAPVMSSFIVYLLSLSGIVVAFRQSRKKFLQARYLAAMAFLAGAAVSAWIYFVHDARAVIAAPSDPANSPMGTAFGIKPGRVVWVWSPEATNENCTHTGPTSSICSGTDSSLMWPSETNSDYYFLKKNNNQKCIDTMVYHAIMAVADTNNIKGAWDKIFKDFNNRKGKGKVGYKAGEKIFIKINTGGIWNNANKDPHLNPNPPGYTGCWGVVDGHLRRLFADQNVLNSNPFAVLSVIKSLVDAGVPDSMIYVGDPIKNVYQDMYEYWKSSFPNLKVLGNDVYTSAFYDITTLGRTKVSVTSTDKIFYSCDSMMDGTNKVISDKLYTIHEQASYLIDMAAMKAHARAGISLCAKNHFGSQARSGSAGHLHGGLICSTNNDAVDRGGYRRYRVLTDIMGHKLLGGNTVLFVVDATWAQEEGYVNIALKKWRMAPFNNDYPSSIFMSQDGVAIESVCFDFLRSEYDGTGGRTNRPNYSGVDDYLHQAADPSQWPVGFTYDPENDGIPLTSMGVHEHWNNSTLKQYSRNLNPTTGKGIELFFIRVNENGVLGLKEEVDNRSRLNGIYPNPVSGQATIEYSLEEKTAVTLSIVDLNGRIVKTIVSQEQPAGNYTFLYDANTLPAGLYYCTMMTSNQTGTARHTAKFQVLK